MMDFTRAEFVMSAGRADGLPPSDSAEIAFCGRSNVGKSSLLNKLCGRKKLARVSSTPGKTTTINFFTVPGGFSIVDLPGYGYAKRSDDEKRRWAELTERYFTSGRNIVLALLLLDSRRVPNGDDLTMLNYLHETGIPFLTVLTKTDKLKKRELEENAALISKTASPYGPVGFVPFSTEDNSAGQRLTDAISGFLGE